MTRKIKYLLPLITLMIFSLSYSQISEKGREIVLNKNFNQYAVESFFLDTDKNQYLSSETIWFKLYVLEESTNQLNLNTQKVHISLFKDKNKIESQTLFVENGIAYGNFKTTKDFESGPYYFQVNTNYNTNFKDPANFPIEIVSITKNQSSVKETANNEISQNETLIEEGKPVLEFYAESNSFLKNVHNKIIISTNLPENTDINILETTTNQIISTTKTNKNGEAIAFFKYDSNYKALVNFNNQDYFFNIPTAQEKGFTIFKNRLVKDAKAQTFILKTNLNTAEFYNNKKVFVILHKKGYIKSFAELTINNNQLDYLISFNTNDLYNGTNTISILTENHENLVNRFFYNENHIKINATHNTISNDSIKVNLQSNQISNFASLSVAVHSENFNQLKSNIKSSLYFDNNLLSLMSNTDNFDLNSIDNYLQIKASQANPFPYKKIVESSNILKRDNGFEIKGKVNTDVENTNEHKVMLTSKDNNILLVQDLDTDKSFVFRDLYIKKDSNYELALLNKKGKIIKASFYVYQNHTDFSNKTHLNIKPLDKTIKKLNKEVEDTDFIYYSGIEQLEEVTVEYEKESEEKLKKALRDNNILGSAFSRVYTLKDAPFTHLGILTFLQTINGVRLKFTSKNEPYLNNELAIQTINSPAIRPIDIVVDGMEIGTDLSLFSFRQASDFEFVIFNKTGGSFGSRYPNGVINLVTYRGTDGNPLPPKNYDLKNFVADFGFSESYNRFESSLINYGTDTNKNKFKTIDWFPDIKLLNSETSSFNVSSEGLKNLKLTVNGVTDTGDLIYSVITIN